METEDMATRTSAQTGKEEHVEALAKKTKKEKKRLQAALQVSNFRKMPLNCFWIYL